MNERILVLDDEASILDIVGQHLADEAYECTLTTSAFRALELLQEEDFALLITDLKMPEMHGIEVVRRAKEQDRDLAVIVITALLEVTNAIEAMRAGADDYLPKPFNLSEITLSVERALERRRLVMENRQYQEQLESRVHEATRELEAANHELRATKEYLESLLHSSVDAIVTVGNDGRITFTNQGAVHMLGYEKKDLIGKPAVRLFASGADEARYVSRMLRQDKVVKNYETELTHRSGMQIPVNMSVSAVRDAGGTVVSILAICKDITEQKRLEAELKEMTIKDSLTGLYNQRYFYDRLEAEIERARRQRHPLSLLLFDIDQFKTYNDCHGHLEGDRVLKTTGQVVLECTREHVDIGFRYGGDEFTIILPEAAEEQALNIAERIRDTFKARRFDHLTLSIGLMAYTGDRSMRSFIRFTDAMMYDAKRSGGDRVFVYNPASAPAAEASDEDSGPVGGGAPVPGNGAE